VRLVFGGDIMLGRHVRAFTCALGADHPFSGIADILGNADVRLANLECAVVPDLAAVPATRRDMITSVSLARGLSGRFDVLSLANNHILDHGEDAGLATQHFCIANGIAPIGFGATPAEARSPLVVERSGLTVAFLAYTEDIHGLKRRTHPGPAYLDEGIMRADIAAVRPQANLVVVSLHADLQYATVPAPWRVALSRRLIDAGATLVIGHHPHVPQGLERHGAGLIAYSVGNLVYDAPARSAMLAESPLCARSILVEVELDRRGVVAHRIHPLRIDDTCRPVPLTGAEREPLLAMIEASSEALSDPQAIEHAWRLTCRRKLQEWVGKLRGFPSTAEPDQIISLLPRLLYGTERHWVTSIVEELIAALPPIPSDWGDSGGFGGSNRAASGDWPRADFLVGPT
jgi:poly-gamma-glutamate synthesis protein (capsule biosynthesis protein)